VHSWRYFSSFTGWSWRLAVKADFYAVTAQSTVLPFHKSERHTINVQRQQKFPRCCK